MNRATTMSGVVGLLLSLLVFLPAGHAMMPLGLFAVGAIVTTLTDRSAWDWSVPTLYLVAAVLLWLRHVRRRFEFALGAGLSIAGAVVVAALLWGTPVGYDSIDGVVWGTAVPSGLALMLFVVLAVLQKREERHRR